MRRKLRAILAVWVVVAALASTGVGLEVDVLELDFQVAPGQTQAFSFVVRNETDIPETFLLYPGDWDRNELGENRFYPPGTLSRSLSDWISVAPASFTLGAGEARQVSGTLSVPQDAAPGTHWGIVFIHGEPRAVEREGTMVTVTKRIGVKIYATVGSVEREGEVRGVHFGGLNPLWFVTEFANPGIVNLEQVHVEAQVYDAYGELLAHITPPAVPCLPGGVRWLVARSDLRPEPGTYFVVVRVDFGAEEIIAAEAYLRVRPLALVPIVGDAPPRDLNGDGLYEDIDGNGVFDERDVELFAEYWMRPAVQGNWRAFDFNNSGRVDERDVEALAELLERYLP